MKVVVVGGGITGLATAFNLVDGARASGEPLDVEVFEAGSQAGGTIGSEVRDGAVHEWGPNGWLSGDTATDRLIEHLGLEAELIQADPAAARRFIVLADGLVEVPTSPPAFFRSSILSMRATVRLLAEPFIGPPGPGSDESVAEFGRRRLGQEVVDHILDPVLTGIYAGDVDRTSMAAAFPAMAALEHEHGSLTRGAIARRRSGFGGGYKRLVSLRGGMGDLVGRLAESIGDRLYLDTSVRVVEPRAGGGFRITTSNGLERAADCVVLAVPAPVVAELCADFLPAAAKAAGQINYAPVAVVETVHRREDVDHHLDGFGFLCSRASGRSILGTIWSSSVFPGHRSPDGHVTLRTLVGGTRQPDLAASADVLERVLSDLDDLVGLSGPPRSSFIRRWESAIPQYEVGHLERVRIIDHDARAVPGFFVIGNAFRGVSVNDCTAAAERVATQLLTQS